MRRLLAVALIALTMATSAAAQTPSPAPTAGKKLVLLAVPVVTSGEYQPLTEAQIQQALEQAVEAQAPNVDLVWSKTAAEDSYTTSQAMALGTDAKADLVSWGRLTFQRTVNNVPQSYGSQVYVTEIGVTGSGRMTLLDVSQGVTFSDRTYPFFSTTRTSAVEGSDAFAKAEDEVALQFVKQIAGYLVKAIRNQVQQGQSP